MPSRVRFGPLTSSRRGGVVTEGTISALPVHGGTRCRALRGEPDAGVSGAEPGVPGAPFDELPEDPADRGGVQLQVLARAVAVVDQAEVAQLAEECRVEVEACGEVVVVV